MDNNHKRYKIGSAGIHLGLSSENISIQDFKVNQVRSIRPLKVRKGLTSAFLQSYSFHGVWFWFLDLEQKMSKLDCMVEQKETTILQWA